jgi:hypothetical protein
MGSAVGLFVSFVAPHFPLTAPPAWFYRYWKQDLPMPKLTPLRSGRGIPTSTTTRTRSTTTPTSEARTTSSARSPATRAW